jgi:hypothetical protein
MEHRLIVTSECGFLYHIVDGDCTIFYDNKDENEYFGKIARYDKNMFAVGGYKHISILMSNDGSTFNLFKVDVGNFSESGTVMFIDDFLVMLSSSFNSAIFIPIEELYDKLLTNITLAKCVVVQFGSAFSFKFNGMGVLNDEFVLGFKLQNKKTWESGVILLEKNFKSFITHQYGWKTSKMSVIDNKVYLLCNSVYKTSNKTCLVVDGKAVIVFHDSYELNDFSVTDEFIYVVGRSIIGYEGTTINRGAVLIFDKKYNLVDKYFIRGSGALLGCINMYKDYANDRIAPNFTEHVKNLIDNKEFYVKVNGFDDKQNSGQGL